MSLFTVVEGAQCVLVSKGVFRQVPVYLRGNDIFARWGSGFIGLRAANATTLPHVRWDYLDGVIVQTLGRGAYGQWGQLKAGLNEIRSAKVG